MSGSTCHTGRILWQKLKRICPTIMKKYPRFGICVDTGWSSLLLRHMKRLELAVRNSQIANKPQVALIWSNWGRLAINLEPKITIPDANDVLHEMIAEAARTCESCGAQGSLRKDIRPNLILCARCYKAVAQKKEQEHGSGHRKRER